MKIATRNVNGIRAVASKWFVEWILHEDIDILCIQEPKAFESQIPVEVKTGCSDYDYVRHRGSRPWYAGTAIFYKKNLINSIIHNKNEFEWYEQLSDDGRTTEIEFNNIKLINCYFPNGGERADGTEMLTYKLRFYETMAAYIESCQAQGFEVIVTGDFNICHREIDIARPKENQNSIGFLPIEREKIWRLMQSRQLVDMFRHLHGDIPDKYTRRSYRAGARPRNVGRRLDYMMASSWLVQKISSCEHYDQTIGSDHCPVMIELKL